MSGFLSELLTEYQVQIERHRNRPFLRAVMAGCSLVAIADGEVSLSERIRVDQILETLDELKVFDPHEAVDLFNAFSKGIMESPAHGRQVAIDALQVVADDPEKSELLVKICLAISEAKGGKSLVDQIEIVMLCSLLGVRPGECGLYTDFAPEDILRDDS